MAKIDQLSTADVLGSGDLIPVHQQANDDTRAVPVGVFAARVSELILGEVDQTVYNLTMAGSSFSASVLPASVGASAWLQLNPPGTAPSATISLPDADNRANGQEVLVTCTQAVTSLTLNGMGASVAGAPSSLSVNGFFRLRYDSVVNCWFRVG